MPDPTPADPGEIRVPDVVFWTLSNPGHSSDGQARVSAPRAQWEQLCSDARTEHAVSGLLDEIYPASVYGTLGNLRQLIDANAALRAELDALREERDRLQEQLAEWESVRGESAACQDCGQPYEDFHVPHAVWIKVIRPDSWAGGGTLCWDCFQQREATALRAERDEWRQGSNHEAEEADRLKVDLGQKIEAEQRISAMYRARLVQTEAENERMRKELEAVHAA